MNSLELNSIKIGRIPDVAYSSVHELSHIADFFPWRHVVFCLVFLPLSFYGVLSSCKMCFLRRACYAVRNITFWPHCSDGHYSSALMHVTSVEKLDE